MSAIVISGGADVRVGQNVRKRLLLPLPGGQPPLINLVGALLIV